MDILVIGNGFDLEHGLPTNYKDFLDFMQGIKLISSKTSVVNEQSFIEELENVTKHKIDENIKKYLTNENFLYTDSMEFWKVEENAKKLITCANNNVWIKYFIENIDYEKKGWIDFESEISNVIQCFNYMEIYCEYCKDYLVWPNDKEQEKYNKQESVEKILVYSGLDIKPFELIGKKLEVIIGVLNEDLNNLIRSLEIYLEEFINKIDVEFIAPDIKENHCDKVLSFNYTNTHHRLYDIYPTNPKEYDYIHGKADINRALEENNMVLGIDEYLDNEAKDKELEFIAFKKYFQRIYKKTGNTYKKWVKEIEDDYKEKLKNEEKVAHTIARSYDEFMDEALVNMNKDHKNKIYIFGHSLDVTDKDAYAQQITNMVKIIGHDELIKRVSGAYPTIIFKQQQKRIEIN